MDYKEKYEQVIESLRGLIKNDSDHVIYEHDIIECVPELKESEDERIRKDIIVLVKDWWDRVNKDNISTKEQMISWLENQCEHNSFSWTEDDEAKVKAMCEEGNLKPSEREWLNNLRYRVTEHKPTDKYEPMSLNEAIEHCKEKSCGNNACALEHKQLEKWLTELKKLKEKKSSWSEEEGKKQNYLIALLQNSTMNNPALRSVNEGLEDWLKSLKDRVQPKQEWSEEDRKIIIELIGMFESAVDGGYVDIPYRLVKDYIRVLKSCLPQTTWKPSEEQLNALHWCVMNVGSTEHQVLQELLEQLEKLKD